MNSPAADPHIQHLLNTTGVRDPVADALGDDAPPRIDWIFSRGLRTIDAGLIDTGASDHPCVWAELVLAD
jgi:endonuclease/exonuclease/phosphatase (EEP) superfamily protein YafD